MRPSLLAALAAPVLAAAFACASSRSQASGPSPTPKVDSAAKAASGAAPPGAAPAEGAKPPAAAASGGPAPRTGAPSTPPADSVRRVAPPEVAHAHGWMPLASTGVDRFLRAQPEADGRGVLIGILDTGIDPGVPGLLTTSTGGPKILDLRDFSGEGAVPLARVTPAGDSVEVGGRRLGGFGRVVALNTAGPYYAGTIAELPLGPPPAADLNGNGAVRDTLPIVVVRATDGWVLLADTDGDGSLAGERPIHDYLVGRESFGWAPKGGHPRVNVAANFGADVATPRLDLFFDTGGHGTHVSGIAAGHDLYGVPGFDGVAPGAQLLGLKIANSAQGGITTTGSMLRAMDYAITFAEARHLPLVLNMSFGVGNELEGQARIDGIVDSVLAAHPDVVLAISAGNDGPGLSTIGFPGSASRAISVGATLPSSFLPPGPTGAPSPDQLAYFSSRGGEVARPDVVTPGVAYSTVPLWNAGDEVEQGTSMAAPHAAGLAALLESAASRARRPITARDVRQALMVTAQPTPGATFVDEGGGLADVDRAWRWLSTGPTVAEVGVRAVGPGDATGAVLRGLGGLPDTVQSFELVRSAGAPAATYTLRSDAPWLTAPAALTLKGRRTTLQLKVARKTIAAPGAAVGTITGWGTDTLAGPAFRLVVTVIAAAPVASGTQKLREKVALPAGSTLRTFFQADSARPFALIVETNGRAQRALSFLHEPDGMPFRDEGARSAGFGPQSAEYEADSRDVVPGAYESVVVAPPNEALTATVSVSQSPLALRAVRQGESVHATFTNLTGAPVEAVVGMHLGGAARLETVTASGSAVQRIPFVVPRWSRGVVIDIAMDRAQWGRFTDFGVTLFDSLGQQLGKQPLNYDFGRLQVELPEGHGDVPVTLGLFPGFADAAGDQHWSLRASIRVYADTSVVLARADTGSQRIAPHATATADFALPPAPWPLGPKFVPLGLLVARADDRSWTREIELTPPGTTLVP
jgi:subtilisin family serine protease